MACKINPTGLGGNDRSSIAYEQNDENQSSMSVEESSNTHSNVNLHQRIFVNKANQSNRNICEMTPFLIEKAIKGTVGTVKNVRKLRSGLLLVEVESEALCLNLNTNPKSSPSP